MKKPIYNIVLYAMILYVTGCKKITTVDTVPLSSVNVVNSIRDANAVRLNKNTIDVALYSSSIQAVDAGSGNIKAYDATTNAVYYNQAQETVNGGLYSLYLTGTVSAPDGVWIKDSIKPYGTENTTTTVRVVNLSNAGPVNVSLLSNPGTNVFSNVAYKTVSAFQDFPMPLAVPGGSTTFEFRDVSNTIIASFTLPDGARNRSYAIVLKGLVGGTGSSAIGCIGQAFY